MRHKQIIKKLITGESIKGKSGLLLLILGLLLSLYLLKMQLDNQKTEIEAAMANQSLAEMPNNPVVLANKFIENIKQMPATEERVTFINYATEAVADGELTAIEYNQIKSEHHALQEDAIKSTPPEVADLDISEKP